MLRRDLLKSATGILTLPAIFPFSGAQGQQNATTSDPWTADETVSPAGFAKELAASAASDNLTIVCVGFHNFYESAHIPGASFHGPSSTANGLADLKQYAHGLAQTMKLVIYCGCCPLIHCPNVRPAFSALREMGFAHLRLLALTRNFAEDWLKADYPVAKTT